MKVSLKSIQQETICDKETDKHLNYSNWDKCVSVVNFGHVRNETMINIQVHNAVEVISYIKISLVQSRSILLFVMIIYKIVDDFLSLLNSFKYEAIYDVTMLSVTLTQWIIKRSVFCDSVVLNSSNNHFLIPLIQWELWYFWNISYFKA